MLQIDYAAESDFPFWKTLDSYLPESEFLLKVNIKRVYVLKDDDILIGVMRYNLFWDLIPFLTLIIFDESYRNKGYGTLAMLHWENEMRSSGHKLVMTSTMVEETSQHFYRKLGYKDSGCLIKDFPPYVETMEMFMMKQL
ncbi:MAG: GNAT family N-acetyltransferase [Oscillospiraceae bacterium]|nr:GNAT family N-acetyltransferase [Oscillospiraceae bacterium]